MNRMASTPISDQERRSISNTLALKAQCGDESVIEELIRLNEPLVQKIITKMRIFPDNDDAFMAGTEGLLRAIAKFDPNKGDYFDIAFSEVRSTISMTIGQISHGTGMKLGVWKKSLRIRKDFNKGISSGLSSEESIESIALNLGMTTYSVRMLLSSQNVISDTGGLNGESYSVFDGLSDGVTPESVNIQRQSQRAISEIINEVLDERAQRIVRDYYGFGDSEEPKTLLQIGNHYVISAERVRQILVQSQVRIRKRLQEIGLQLEDFHFPELNIEL